jgi:GAF domain-containing protein
VKPRFALLEVELHRKDAVAEGVNKLSIKDPPNLANEQSQLVLLHRISGIVSSDLTLDRMLGELVGLVVSVTECDACLVYLIDEFASEIVLCASQLPHETEIGNIRMKVGEGVTGWVAKHQSVVALSSKASSDPRFKTFSSLPEDTYESLLSVPLIYGGAVIGVINVHHKNVCGHSPEDVALVSYVAEQMGGAIARARLMEQSQSATRKVEILAAVGDTITTEGYLDRILQVISEMVAQMFDSPLCSIMVVDAERNELAVKAARCSSPEFLNMMPVPIDASPIGRVIRDRKILVVEDLLLERRSDYPELEVDPDLSTLLSVPLIAGPSVVGALNIYLRQRRSFTPEEIRFARAVAGQAALALENARLIAETLQMKRTLEARKIIERAKGILQHRDGLTEEEAYLYLRGESRRLRKPMRSLAEALILAEDLHRRGKLRKEPTFLQESELPGYRSELSAISATPPSFDEGWQDSTKNDPQ